jgi:hypothetical protein
MRRLLPKRPGREPADRTSRNHFAGLDGGITLASRLDREVDSRLALQSFTLFPQGVAADYSSLRDADGIIPRRLLLWLWRFLRLSHFWHERKHRRRHVRGGLDGLRYHWAGHRAFFGHVGLTLSGPICLLLQGLALRRREAEEMTF